MVVSFGWFLFDLILICSKRKEEQEMYYYSFVKRDHKWCLLMEVINVFNNKKENCHFAKNPSSATKGRIKEEAEAVEEESGTRACITITSHTISISLVTNNFHLLTFLYNNNNKKQKK